MNFNNMDKLIIKDQEYELEYTGHMPFGHSTPIVQFKDHIYVGKAIVKTSKEWEILSFVSKDANRLFLKYCGSGKYRIFDGKDPSAVGVYNPSFEDAIKNAYYKIHSFKRFSDNQIFAIGDICDASKDYPGYPNKPIKKIFLDENNVLLVKFDEGSDGGCVSFRDVQHVHVVKTEDEGIVSDPNAVVFGCYQSNDHSFGTGKYFVKETKDYAFDWKFFKHEHNRDEYILMHTQLFTPSEMADIIQKHVPSEGGIKKAVLDILFEYAFEKNKNK